MSDSPGGFTLIPDGLWYCDLSHGAARILGWVWCHDNDHVSGEEIRRVFGGTANAWVAELVMAGYLDPHGTSGDRLSYERVAKSWDALA